MQVLNTIQTKLATTVAGLNQRLTIAEKKIGQLQTIGGPSFTFKNDMHILGNEVVDGTLTVGGAGQFNGGAGVSIAQNLIVGTTIVAGGTITANQVVAGGISTSASLGGTTIRTTGNAQFDGTLQTGSSGQFTVSAAGNVVANQVVAGGITTSASLGGTTVRGTGNAQFDGTLVIGGAASFNGGAGVTIAQNLIVGTTVTATQVVAGGITTASSLGGVNLRLTGGALIDGTITSGTSGAFSVSATGAISPCASIHCTGAGQFDTTLQSGTSGVFSVTAAGAITSLSAHMTGGFQVDGTANINTLNINGSLFCGSGKDIHALSISTTAAASIGTGLTVGTGINADSIHTTGVGQFDGSIKIPTISGLPLSGTQTTASVAGAVNAIYNAIT